MKWYYFISHLPRSRIHGPFLSHMAWLSSLLKHLVRAHSFCCCFWHMNVLVKQRTFLLWGISKLSVACPSYPKYLFLESTGREEWLSSLLPLTTKNRWCLSEKWSRVHSQIWGVLPYPSSVPRRTSSLQHFYPFCSILISVVCPCLSFSIDKAQAQPLHRRMRLLTLSKTETTGRHMRTWSGMGLQGLWVPSEHSRGLGLSANAQRSFVWKEAKFSLEKDLMGPGMGPSRKKDSFISES